MKIFSVIRKKEPHLPFEELHLEAMFYEVHHCGALELYDVINGERLLKNLFSISQWTYVELVEKTS